MANCQNWTSKTLQEILQNCQGRNIQVICRFVQEKNIWFFQEQFEEIKTFFFSPRQFLNQGSMRRTWEKELLQQLCNGSCSTTASLNLFCHFLQVIDHSLAFIQALNLLREIGDANSFPNHNLSCCRLKNACNQVKES